MGVAEEITRMRARALSDGGYVKLQKNHKIEKKNAPSTESAHGLPGRQRARGETTRRGAESARGKHGGGATAREQHPRSAQHLECRKVGDGVSCRIDSWDEDGSGVKRDECAEYREVRSVGGLGRGSHGWTE
jgi:hypothetical protein